MKNKGRLNRSVTAEYKGKMSEEQLYQTDQLFSQAVILTKVRILLQKESEVL